MSDTSAPEVHQPLGVGAIISESFSILFGNLVPVAITSIVPIVIGTLLSGLFVGMPIALGIDEPDFLGGGAVIFGIVASSIVQLFAYGVVIAALVQLAYDAKLSRPIAYKKYASAAIATIIPNVVTMLLVGIVVGLGSLFFLIPGLWLLAVFLVVVPAIVIERAGFGAVGRSRQLTRGYRWPVLGAYLVVWVCVVILSLVATFLVTMIVAGLGSLGIFAAVILQGLLLSIAYGLSSIAVALIYARLREIKEGVSVDNLVAVFE